jgi:hypothetical protein
MRWEMSSVKCEASAGWLEANDCSRSLDGSAVVMLRQRNVVQQASR